ncbi:unnamed protein product [Miscanthus lutarioriparius]|uniref:Uncharacterized protein n=1 Tax=Miscanthus lutarioriparius TaxID=422564 RepID=A0A811NSU8_9POAL|nr:unnamed protein product [Miscanthus lutarioriparius]
MGSSTAQQKPHVVLVPFPAHGHVAPHVQLARALHARGVHATLVHTELHHRRLLQAAKAAADDAATAAPADEAFAVEVIPDGLSLDDPPRTLRAAHEAMERNCLEPFKALLRDLLLGTGRPGVPPVTCVVADTPMPFAAVAAREEIVPLSPAYETDGSLDAPLDWVPGMKGALRLRDMPTFCRTTDADDWLLHFHVHQMKIAAASKAVILNTVDDMEKDVLDALAPLLPPIYTVGPLASVVVALASTAAAATTTSTMGVLQEDKECMAWLDGKAARSVVYFSVGSHASMGDAQLKEIASGLARCGSPYLWVLRPEMAAEVEVGEDGLVVPWCPQEAVLNHPAVGLFVTHCGWNSILESVVAGVPGARMPRAI